MGRIARASITCSEDDRMELERISRSHSEAKRLNRGLTMHIVQAATPEEIEIVRSLIKVYATWLALDLSFQNFDE